MGAIDKEPLVLLVEDSDDDAALFSRLLVRVPVTVERVRGVRDALLALAVGPKYDLVLTDLNLPDASGLLAVTTLVRQHDAVLVLTGDPMYDAYDAIKLGADDLVFKNDNFPTIRRAITVALARAARRRAEKGT